MNYQETLFSLVLVLCFCAGVVIGFCLPVQTDSVYRYTEIAPGEWVLR